MKRRRLPVYAAWAVLACAAVLGALPSYFLIFEQPYLTYQNLPVPVIKSPARPGDSVPIWVERCNSDAAPHNYNTTHNVMNMDTGVTLIMPDVEVLIMPGCTMSESRINQLPKHLIPGRYRIFGMAEVKGTLKVHYIPWYSQPFEVML
jgi:hypothetical protein